MLARNELNLRMLAWRMPSSLRATSLVVSVTQSLTMGNEKIEAFRRKAEATNLLIMAPANFPAPMSQRHADERLA